MQEPTQLLVLDVENTIIHYPLYARPGADGNIPGEIDGNLVDIFNQFVSRGFAIVINTGTNGANTDYYKREFQRAGIHGFISAYEPKGGNADDSKVDRLNKYCDGNNFKITNKNNVYYYDDGHEVVERAQAAGYANTSHVTADAPLALQLVMLLSRLESGDTVSAATTIAKRGSPVMQRKSQTEGTYEIWYTGVVALHAEIQRLTNLYGIDNPTATAHTYLSSILDAIRKNSYAELAQDPEAHNINGVIFSEIDHFIQDHRFIIERKGISDTQIKSLATHINQSGIPAVQPMAQNNDSFTRWREGVEVLSTIILRLAKLYEMPDPQSLATSYLNSILDAIQTNCYDKLAADSQTNLGIPAILFDGFEGISAYIEANRYIVSRENVSDAQIDAVKTEMNKKSLLSGFVKVPSFESFSW